MKFYDQIIGALQTFFGKEEATEAELHQALTDAGTIAATKEAALKEANDAVAEKMKGFETGLEHLQARFAALEKDAAAKDVKIEALETELQTVKADAETKATKISVLTDLNTALSGQIATLKAGKPVEKTLSTADASLQVPAESGHLTNARQVSQKDIDAALAKQN